VFGSIDELRKRVFWCWRARRLASRPEPATTAGAAFCAVPAADPPHEGPTVAVRLPSSLGFMFYLISTDREMGLSLVLFCCAAVVRRCGGPIILGDSSRFGEFNSRLHRREFPVRGATGICWQAVDLPHCLCGQTAVIWGKSTKFPARWEKPGILPLTVGTGRGAASRQRRRSRLPGADRPVGCQPRGAALRERRGAWHRTPASGARYLHGLATIKLGPLLYYLNEPEH
jgi:hypothetical protein